MEKMLPVYRHFLCSSTTTKVNENFEISEQASFRHNQPWYEEANKV